MDEDQYRATYHKLNPNRCIFEKAHTNRRCDCQQRRRFVLATREGIACRSESSLKNCTKFLNLLRDSSRFALKITLIDGPLPHNKELRVQAGGTLALQTLLQGNNEDMDSVENIDQLLKQALIEYGELENIPYSELIKGVLTYKVRRKKRKKD